MSVFQTNLIKNLEYIRHIKKKSQVQFARDFGYSHARYNNYKTGISTPHLKDLEHICNVLNVSISHLVEFDMQSLEFQILFNRLKL